MSALDSLVAQTHVDWELVVVLDGDDDAIRGAVFDRVPTATVVVNDGPHGIVPTLNLGLQQCRGDWVARLDADDVMAPTRLERQLGHVADCGACVVLGSGAELIDERGDVVGVRPSAGPATDVERVLKWRCPVVHSSVVFRRDVAMAVGGYAERARHVEDYDLWLRMATHGSVHALPELLTQYRLHDDQITNGCVYTSNSLSALAASRRGLARERNQSELAAILRHQIWRAVQLRRGRVAVRDLLRWSR